MDVKMIVRYDFDERRLTFVFHPGHHPVEAPADHHRSETDHGKRDEGVLPGFEVKRTGKRPEQRQNNGQAQRPGKFKGRPAQQDGWGRRLGFHYPGNQKYP